MNRIVLFTMLIMLSLNAYSHRGQAKSTGCHKGSSNQYHCHNNSSNSRSRRNKSCGTSRIRDCNNNCSRKNLWGDGDCDAAFNCDRFSYDRWDCVDPPSDESTSSTPIKCGIEKIRDCNNFCNREGWWGDGDCDAFFNCAKLSYDRGDCKESSDRMPLSDRTPAPITPSCSAGEIKNCNDSCSPSDLLGNGHCNSAFNCTQFSYDRGDCKSIDDKVTSPAISPNDANTIRQCTDLKGNITFSDLPCPYETKEHFIVDQTLEEEAEKAASYGVSKMSEFAYQEAGEYFKEAASLLPIGNDEKRAEYLTLGGYAFQKALLYNESIALYERALVIKERAYGKEHPKVAAALHNLALLYQAKGNYTQAKLLFERSLVMIKQFFDNDHPDIMLYASRYDTLLKKIGDENDE